MTQSSVDPDVSLTEARKVRDIAGVHNPNALEAAGEPDEGARVHPSRRYFRRGPWEMAATAIIALGVFMLMQPFFMWAYTYSFITTLIGTVMFIIVSHFPE